MNTWLHWVLTGLTVYAVGVLVVVVLAYYKGRDLDPANRGMEWVDD